MTNPDVETYYGSQNELPNYNEEYTSETECEITVFDRTILFFASCDRHLEFLEGYCRLEVNGQTRATFKEGDACVIRSGKDYMLHTVKGLGQCKVKETRVLEPIKAS